MEENENYPIRELKFRSEEELIELVKQKLAQIEPDIKIIKEKKISFEEIDNFYLVARDKNNSFILIALRIFEDDNWLYQIIDHFEWFQHYIHRWQDSLPKEEQQNINLKEGRIILIAPVFSDFFKKCIPYINIPISLYEYRYLKIGIQEGLVLNKIIDKPHQKQNKPVTVKVEINLSNELEPLYRNFIQRLSQLDSDLIHSYGKNHIDLVYKDKPLGQIRFARNFFWVDAGLGSWQSICVEDEKSLNEAWEKIKHIYIHLGGRETAEENLQNHEAAKEDVAELIKINKKIKDLTQDFI